MAYEFKFTEQNVERASEFETKTLLYLLGLDRDRSEISIIFIDCFNDVTGSNDNCKALWDFQSKGVSNLNPRKIGKSLFTLFSNFTSDFKFRKYALFIPQPKHSYLNNSTIIEFGIDNFGNHREKIKEGLVLECIRRSQNNDIPVEEKQEIDLFLEKVLFIADSVEKFYYVKNLIYFKDKDLKPTQFYTEIFDEIRSVQADKKSISVHKLVINHISEALKFKKHLRAKEITALLINRLVGVELFSRKAIPIDFLPEVLGLDKNDVKDLIQECNEKISRAVFDKNSKENFWGFLEAAISEVLKNTNISAREAYTIVSINTDKRISHLSGLPGVYLICLIKEGFDQ